MQLMLASIVIFGLIEYGTFYTPKQQSTVIRRFASGLKTSVRSDNNDPFSMIRKGFVNFLASAATMQTLAGAAVASSQDENYETLTESLLQKLVSKDRTIEAGSFARATPTITTDIPDNSDKLPDGLYEFVEQVQNLDLEGLTKFDESSFNSKVVEIRDAIRFLSTDWKAWACALAVVVTSDAVLSLQETRKLNKKQKDQIDLLYKKLKFLEEQGLEKADNVRQMELQTKMAVSELENLSEKLQIKTLELEQLRSSLEELQSLDNELLASAKREKLELQKRLQTLANETSIQRDEYELKIAELNVEYKQLQGVLDEQKGRETELMDALRAFLINQEYLPHGVANMLLPATAIPILLETRTKLSPKDMEARVVALEQANSELRAKVEEDKATIQALTEKLSRATAKLEESTEYQLGAMTRMTALNNRIAQQEAGILSLKQMLVEAKAQLNATDAAGEAAVLATQAAVERARALERDVVRLTALMSSLEADKQKAVERAASGAEQLARSLKVELDVTSEKLSSLLETEVALKTAEITIQSLNQELVQANQRLRAMEDVDLARAAAERLVQIQADEMLELKKKLDLASLAALAGDSLRNTVSALATDLEATKAKLVNASVAVLSKDVVQRNIEKLSAENAELRVTLAATEQKLAASEDRVSRIANKLEALEQLMIDTAAARGTLNPEGKSALQYMKGLSAENDELKQKLLVSEDRLWDVQQDAQTRLSSVKSLARELTEKLGINFFTQGGSIADSSETTDETARLWRSLPVTALMKKSKDELEGALTKLGASEKNRLSSLSKADLVALLLETLSEEEESVKV